MTWVLVAIAEGAAGDAFAGLRDDEIGIGHESAFLVALSRSPIVARLADVDGLLGHYYGEGSPLPDRGVEWVELDEPADTMATYPWFDQDARSIYLAQEILEGRLAGATEEERDLAVSWTAYAERLQPDRPRDGLREAPERCEQRAYVDELRAALRRATDRNAWHRLDERRALSDGSVLVVEQDTADGGWYVGRYVLSRYRGVDLVERTYL